MSKFHEVLSGLPTEVRLRYAACKKGSSKNGTLDAEPKEAVVVMRFSESGFGFGEITIKQTPRGVFLDTEYMSRERVKKYLAMFVDSAIIDYDQDPERHALFNEVMGRQCGPACGVCFPESSPPS